MKGLLTVFTLFALLSLSHSLVKKGPSQDALQFLEGIAVGIEAEIGNVTVCAKDLNITLDDFDAAYADISYGLENLSGDAVEDGLIKMGDGLVEVAVAFKACGLEELSEDIATLAEELSSGVGGIVEVVVDEVLNIFSHGHDITSDFRDAVDSWEAGNYYQSGFYTGEILAILLED